MQNETNEIEASENVQQEPKVDLAELISKIERNEIPASELDKLDYSDLERITKGDFEIKAAPQEKSESVEVKNDLVPGQKYKEKANEANHFKMKYQNNQKEIESLKSKIDELTGLKSKLTDSDSKFDFNLTPPKNEDGEDNAYDEKYLTNVGPAVKQLRDEINELKNQLSKKAELEASSYTEILQSKQVEQTFNEIDQLQYEVPEFKTSIPFKDIDKEYSKITQALKDQSQINRYISDPEFRKQKELEGLNQPQDFDKYIQIMTLYKKKNQYPSLKSAYNDSQLREEHLKNRFLNQNNVQSSYNQNQILQKNLSELKNKSSVMDIGLTDHSRQNNKSVLENNIRFLESWKGKESLMNSEQSKRYEQILEETLQNLKPN